MDWEDLRYFLAVAKARTATGAARELKASPSTVIKRVSDLERSLGQLLFDRSREGYALTAFGQAILQRALPLEAAAHDIARFAEGAPTAPSGLVRVSTTESLASGWLAPRLAAFHRQHPAIQIEIFAGAEVVSLGRREADVALRLARPEGGDLRARRVGEVAFAGYRLRGADVDPGAWIAFHEQPARTAIARLAETRLGGRAPVLRAGDFATHQAAARSGLACAVLPCFLGDPDPLLERVEPGDPQLSLGLWLVVHRDLRSAPRVQAVLDFLADQAQVSRRLLAGR
ncbi:MAG: LysR family transcriptional regulator [Phenylobacterium sp.]|jgi:DNA-binding transcriptional LysR family regulator|uniref:LysR family transcriptional regulator n=1 Tax=Phenylobacterium sp. TaxID=1871053 RepID=UPI002A36DCE7|nr:LysR family transcriptional regulator [Phenylobacterium sp.]MDX9998392.1 LysR family transcriptional regulator [Phenylobacterium sp.]